jgi:hypothetical protein
MILYVPNNMHSSQVTHICNKEVSLKSLQEPHDFQKGYPCHETTYKRLDARKVCMK